jgi:hypothetical protein
MALSPTQDGLLTAVVVAGQDGAALETAAFRAPPVSAAAPGNKGAPVSRTPAPPCVPAQRPGPAVLPCGKLPLGQARKA